MKSQDGEVFTSVVLQIWKPGEGFIFQCENVSVKIKKNMTSVLKKIKKVKYKIIYKFNYQISIVSEIFKTWHVIFYISLK